MNHSSTSRMPLPREHGAWAMFAVPLLVGIGAARAINFSIVLFALTAFGFFLVRYPLMLTLKSRDPNARRDAIRWSAIYGAITGACGALLMIVSQAWSLVPIGALGMFSLAIYLWLVTRRAEMSLAGEWIGIVGLSLGAPGAYLVGAGSLDATAFALYILNVLYFGGTIFYIKFKVREQPRTVQASANWQARLWAGRITIAYHALVLIVLAAFVVLGNASALVPIAFMPAMCKAIGGALTRPAKLNLRHLGFIELGFTIVFTITLLIAYQ